jgi:hypothetical protein
MQLCIICKIYLQPHILSCSNLMWAGSVPSPLWLFGIKAIVSIIQTWRLVCQDLACARVLISSREMVSRPMT